MGWFDDNAPSGGTQFSSSTPLQFQMPGQTVTPQTADPSTGALAQGYGQTFDAPTDVTMQNDPGYQFRLKQEKDAVEKSAAGRGTLLTGGTLSDVAQRVGDLASQEYQNTFARKLAAAGFNRDTSWGDSDRLFGRNLSLAQLGLGAAEGANAADTAYYDAYGNLVTGHGNVQGAGAAAQGQAYGSAVGSVGASYSAYADALKKLFGSKTPSGTTIYD